MPDQQKRGAFASLSTLFRPRHTQQLSSLRPPYPHENADFEHVCIACTDTPCIRACEEEIIVLDEKKLPSLVFTKSGCTFCKECALACPSAILDPKEEPSIKAQFWIDTKNCIAWNNVICNSCADVCDVKAITFFGLLRPLLEKETCTHCGFCYGICPTNAIQYRLDFKGV